MERQMWSMLDQDSNGAISTEEVKHAEEQLLQLLHERRPKGSGQAQDMGEVLQLQELAKDAVFAALDSNRDGSIDQEEFCRIAKVINDEVQRVYALGKHFSDQILESPSACTRYGAYYVLRSARTSSSPSWAMGADAVIFVNTSSPHAAPSFQAALTNAMLARRGLDKTVSVRVHPFAQTQYEQHDLEKIVVFLLAIYITFCLSFIPAGIVHFLVKERASGARQLQVLSGASHMAYWSTNLAYDMVLYVVPALCVPIALHQFGFGMILEGNCGTAVALTLTLFGPALASFSYLVSFVFREASQASNAVLSFCLVGASVLSTVLFILGIINYNPTAEYPWACEHPTEDAPQGSCFAPRAKQVERVLGPLFRLVPTVCLYQALLAIALVANLQKVIPQGAMEALSSLAGAHAPKISLSPFAYEWAGEPLRFLAVEGLIYFLAVVVFDTWMHSPRLERCLDAETWLRMVLSARRPHRGDDVARSSPLIEHSAARAAGDDSVELERERTSLVTPQDAALHVSGLEKTYRRWLSFCSPPKRAVRGVSFAVHSGEVFGLLGHNGAGKTSAIRCFIGEQCCTAGAVHVGGFDMERSTTRARRRIGYCPQFDALLELLTVQDHLDLFAALKGLPAEAALQARSEFRLDKMAHRRADVLSGGNKRKLSAAIALMGGPSVAVLDEPSCGLDPAARRALWGALNSTVAGSAVQPWLSGGPAVPSAVLLTTHSMEEAEALSTRLGILADGRLLTVGTSQQIKQRHGGSHELCFSLRQEDEGALAARLQHLGLGSLAPATAIDMQVLGPLLEKDSSKRHAYARPRSVVRAQIEATGYVEAVVLAEWWLLQERGEAIEHFLRGLVGEDVELVENFGLFWRFRLPHGGVGLPELFRQLEGRGRELGIAEYTLSQATLEQIFNGIAQEAEQERQQMGASG